MLNFEDRSILKHVADHKGYIIVIETDHINPGKLQINIYKDNVSSLGGLHVKNIVNISQLPEAKIRSHNAMKTILDNPENSGVNED